MKVDETWGGGQVGEEGEKEWEGRGGKTEGKGGKEKGKGKNMKRKKRKIK